MPNVLEREERGAEYIHVADRSRVLGGVEGDLTIRDRFPGAFFGVNFAVHEKDFFQRISLNGFFKLS